MDNKKIILDLCGGTGSWSHPYSQSGEYDVRIIDPRSSGVDVRWFMYPKEQIHGILAAPPCTDFSGSGAQYWKRKDSDGSTLSSIGVVDACLRIIITCNPTWWALENPIGRLKYWLGPPMLSFDPCDYGDAYTKRTLVWGKFKIPPFNKVTPIKVCNQGSWIMKLGGKSERTKMLRSVTPQGFANAFFKANP